ncbi:hypothetical protein COLO4_20894 [Corchorus olitorius]|uniref:Uncharacterized protein n=1 Tax=Corchorus olitorius TaxID=93759 RepID=A0A1R3IW97_9ROSI|nr:hypothetical protein COLO4_20894 [Corchorus olitorius]
MKKEKRDTTTMRSRFFCFSLRLSVWCGFKEGTKAVQGLGELADQGSASAAFSSREFCVSLNS